MKKNKILLTGHIRVVEWYRESTHQWIVEGFLDVPGRLAFNVRYPSKFKFLAYVKFYLNFTKDLVKDYKSWKF